MNVGQMIAEARALSSDVASPPLVSDALYIGYADEAQLEAVRRGKLIVDSTTAGICTINYTTSSVIPLDPRIIGIREVMVSGQNVPLDPILMSRANGMLGAGWRLATGQYPTSYLRDYGTNAIYLHPTPTQAGTLVLSVWREPLVPLTALTGPVADGGTPEIPARYHHSLVQWMLYRAYSLSDSEVYRPELAREALHQFEAEFGTRASARNEKWQAEQAGLMTDTLC